MSAPEGYEARPATWVSSGRGMIGTSDVLAGTIDELCYALAAAGACWGADDIGRAFFDGDGQVAGFHVSRDGLLADLADMVNLVRATGGMLIVSGRRYAVAEEASTIGAALPEGADRGAEAASEPYRLPPAAQGLPESDPPPPGLTRMKLFLESVVGGCQWPDGNLDSLVSMTKALRAAGYSVRSVADDVWADANAVTANNSGQATDEFASFADALYGGGDKGGLLWLAAACEGLADSVENLIRQKNAARMQFTLSLEFLVVTWALATALSWITGGGSTVAAMAATEAEGLALRSLLRDVAKSVLMGMWFGGGLDTAGQISRIHFGLQENFDREEIAKAVGEGAVAGGVMGGMGRWLGAGGTAQTTAEYLQGVVRRLLVTGSAGTAGNVAAQAVFDKGHVDFAQAAEFGFGMAAVETFKDAGKHVGTRLSSPGHETAGLLPPGAGHVPAGDGHAPHRETPPGGPPRDELGDAPGDSPFPTRTGDPAVAGVRPVDPPAVPRPGRPSVAEVLSSTTTTTAPPPTAGEVATPEPPAEIHPPRYVEIGALGETAVHAVRIPLDPAESARSWVDGLPGNLDPKVSTAIRSWLTEKLADADRENWTDLLQKGVALSAADTVVYLKPDLRGFSSVEAPGGPRNYPVSFGGDGVESREFGSSDVELTGGAVRIWDTSDEVETLGLPGMGIKTSSGVSESHGLDIMSGRKTMAIKHDYFDARMSFKVFRNGSEIPYGADVPGLSLTIPFPEEFHRVGPLTTGDGPPLLPRHEVTPDAARRVPDHGVLVTAVETTPLALEVQRRALEAGVPSHQVVKILDDLLATVHSEQAMKNRSQWWLTSGSASEAFRHGTSRLRSSEDSFRVTSSVLRLEHVQESDPVPIETRVRDDLGRHTVTSSTSRTGNALNAWVGVKLGVGAVDRVFARLGANIKVGKVHLTSTSHLDLPKVTLIKTTEVTRYDALVRLHVASERLGPFDVDVDVRMELALPVGEAKRFEHDILGTEQAHPHAGPAVPPVLPHGTGEHTPYEPHPQEPAMLAAGRGPGLGTTARLPRSERLVTGIHDAVNTAAPDLSPKALRQVMRDLDAAFARPALEADLTNLLNGIDYRTSAGRYRIEVSARGTLGALHRVEEYPMTVNERRLTGAGATTGWTASTGGGLEAAANARLKIGNVFGVDFPKASLNASAGVSKRTAFASGYTVYYRTETEGTVSAFERAMPIDVELRVTRNGKPVADTSWRVDGATAEIVVPHQHVPRQPVTAQDAARIGRVEPLDQSPPDVVGLNGHVAGVIRIGAMPDLALELAKAHAAWTGAPVPAGRRDVPPEILAVTRPSFLEAKLAPLTSPDGLTVTLPDHGGRHQALRLKVGVAGLEHTGSGPGVEYEQYTNANSRVVTGKGGAAGLEGQIQVGIRAGLHPSGDPETENKFVATAGAAFSAGRGSSESSYEGGMDVARGTYGSDAHWYRGDMVVEATPIQWKGSTVEQGPTTRLRVNQIMDLVAPDQVARHLGLEGPSPDVPPVTEHRGYVSPELAMTSGYVERLDAAKVLPEIVGMFHEQKILFRGEELTASPVMEVLRAQYGEQALSASLVALRDGVITWLPIKRAHGFTDYVGVRVKAVVADGVHSAERPDLRLMLRSEHLSGSGTVRQTGSGAGLRALARYTRYSESTVGGAEVGGGRGSETETSDSRSVGVKDINRVQTYDPSHEFTHPVRYEIELVRSHEPPPGLEQLRRGTRGALRRFAELTGNDTAGRFWDEHRRISTHTRTTDGELRLIVPEHLTVPVAENTPVAGEVPAVGEAPRWSMPTAPLTVNETLREIANQVAVPAAPLVGQWAPVAAVPPKLRGPVPLLSDRPAGYEIGLPRGAALGEAGNPRTMRAQLKALLAHEHEVPGLGGETIRVGINVHRATEVAEAAVKQRVYTQTMTSTGHGRGHGTDRHGRAGGSAGPAAEGLQGTSGLGGGRGSGGEPGSRNTNIRERNKEVSTDNTYYRCAISLVFHGEGRDLVVDVPDGLYLRLSAGDVELLDREHPGFIW